MHKFSRTELNPLLKCEDTNNFYTKLRAKVIGQDEALEKVVDIIQTYKAGLNQKGKPLANVIFLGPSGSGKTHTVETMANCLFGDKKAFFKMNCAEFQNSSSVATLIGAAPGYIGYKQTEPFLSQEKLNKYQTKEFPINLLLLDEIEKSCDAIFQLLLGILDKATLNVNNGEPIDFSNTIIFMTSNLGAEGIVDADKAGLGFTTKIAKKLDSQIKKAAMSALKKKFTPEFTNRLDHSIVFNVLTEEAIYKILQLELLEVKERIFMSKPHTKFTFLCTKKVEEFLLKNGYSREFGARELKRTITKFITNPLASLMMSNQLEFGDVVVVSLKNEELFYEKVSSTDLYEHTDEEWDSFKQEITMLEEPLLVVSAEITQEVEQFNDVLVAGAS